MENKNFIYKRIVLFFICLISFNSGFANYKKAGGILLNKVDTLENPSIITSPYYWAWWGWEPLEHNVRLGGPSYTVDGSAWWAPHWYNRLHSEELVEKVSEVGINLAVTHFFKGFGLEFERKQQQNTAQLVRYAHKHGIKVLGYCQLNSIYYETFLNEVPQAIDWVQRDPLGNPSPWQGKYYRWTPCINNQEFRNYIKKAVRVGITETGLDGFDFDNCFSVPCYCEKCEKQFRGWLANRYPNPLDLFGVDSFKSVHQPPQPSSDRLVNDPLTRTWIRWRCERLSDFVREITTYARSLKPNIILMANPAHPTYPDEPIRRSVWTQWVGKYLDLMITENANSPEIDGDLMVSQIRAHKHASSIGYRAVPTTWAEGTRVNMSDASTRLPQRPSQIWLQVSEAAAFGGVPGANWAIRALGKGNGMRIDIPELRDALNQSLDFAHKNESLILNTQPVTDIAVLYSFPSFAFNPGYTSGQVSLTEEILIRGGFSWQVIFDDGLGRLNEFSVLLIAGQTHLSKEACNAVKSFVANGGHVVMIGENATYDDEGRLLEKQCFNAFQGKQIMHVPELENDKIKDKHWGIFANLPPNWKEVAGGIKEITGENLSAWLIGDNKVALNATKGNQGQLILHLVNYGAPEKSNKLLVELGAEWQGKGTIRLIEPGVQERILMVRKDGNSSYIDVPPLGVYGIIVVQ